MAKVSIIIPVYNAEKFLKKCLDSIVNQTFKDIEIICVNDGSKDNSLSILKEYQSKDSRIVIIDKENAGVSAARNDGIRKSTGEYITFVDSDDWLELNGIESIYKIITEKNVDVVNYNYYVDTSYECASQENIFPKELEDKVYSVKQSDFVEQVNIRILNDELCCSVCFLMIRREVLLKTSLFVIGIPYAEDCILYTELLDKIETLYFLKKPIYHYYNNLNSCTRSSEYYVRNIFACARAYEKLIDIIQKDKFEKTRRIQVMTTRFGKIIMSLIFLVYLEGKQKDKDFIRLLKKIKNEKTIDWILKNADISNLSFHVMTPFKLLIKEISY